MSEPDLYSHAKNIYNLGEFLLWDDRSDIGYGPYKNRVGHYYHGKPAKDHPSAWHHWPIGVALMFLGQMLGSVATLKEMRDAAMEEESFNNQEPVDSSSR